MELSGTQSLSNVIGTPKMSDTSRVRASYLKFLQMVGGLCPVQELELNSFARGMSAKLQHKANVWP